MGKVAWGGGGGGGIMGWMGVGKAAKGGFKFQCFVELGFFSV